ncbi:hypothetical protein ACW9KT_22155 [Hymenobacter sp. HD11105]
MATSTSPILVQAQRQAISFALRYAQHPFLPLEPYEGWLLEAFERGELTLDQVLAHVEAQEFTAARRLAPCLA